MNNQLLSQIIVLLSILVLFFGGAESNDRLPKRAINNGANDETTPPENVENEKNEDVIDEDALKKFVLEYETELKKEIERRKLESGKEPRKVKRENFQSEIEEFENPTLKYNSYRILRKIRSPEGMQLISPEDLITQFQNEGKKLLQNVKGTSDAVSADIVRRLEELQDAASKELSPFIVKGDLSDKEKDKEDLLHYDVGKGYLLNSFKLEGYGTNSMKGNDSLVKDAYAEEDSSKADYIKIDDAYKDDRDKEVYSKEVDNREGNVNDENVKGYNAKGDSKVTKKTNAKENVAEEEYDEEGDAKADGGKDADAKDDDTEGSENKVADKIKITNSNDYTEAQLKEGGTVSTTDKNDDGIHHREGKDLTMDTRKITPSSNGKGHRRAKRNSRKDESETIVKGKKNVTKKRKGKNNNIKEGKMECILTEEKYDERKNGTERNDEERDIENTEEPAKVVMRDIEDVKEGTDYEESQLR